MKQKLSKTKGYTDVTELLAEPVEGLEAPSDARTEAIKDVIVKKLIEELMSFANKSIQRNYKVTQEAVSEQQVDAAQEVITSISSLIAIGVDIKHINSLLLKLYTIIRDNLLIIKLVDEIPHCTFIINRILVYKKYQ